MHIKMTKEYKKTMQMSNWLIRPLTDNQLEYAGIDTHYLVLVLKELVKYSEMTDLILLTQTKQAVAK